MNSEKSTLRRVNPTPLDEEIRRTVRIVHERFGGNIGAFIKAARAKRESERAKEQSASQESETALAGN